MEITIQRHQLAHHLSHVLKAVTSKTTIPILTHIKMVAYEDHITLTGSDANISIESTIPLQQEDKEIVTVQKTGSICLQGGFFSEIVRRLPEDTITIRVDDRLTTTISSGNSEFTLNGIDAEEYPHLPKIDPKQTFRIQNHLLRDVIRQTVFATSTSEGQPVLTGVNWKIDDQKLTCVATDGHRLALRTVEMENTSEKSVVFVIPGKSLNELGKILEDQPGVVDFIVTENQTLFKTGSVLFFSRLLDNNYPDTKRLIPTESETEVRIETKTFLQAMERTWLLAREAHNHVVKLNIGEGEEIEIFSQSPELGKVFDKVRVQSVKGEPLKISFSAKFVMEALRAIDSAEVCVQFTGTMRPFLIQPVDNESVLQLVLPVRSY